jgi:hypothetical protein
MNQSDKEPVSSFMTEILGIFITWLIRYNISI